MRIPPGRLILLDTNVIVHLARNDATGNSIENTYHLIERSDRPLISTITEGELLGYAKYNKWGKKNVEELHDIINELVRVESSHPEIIEMYAELYSEGRSKGKPCGENDLWIAATAKALDATLITCDKDFDWLHPQYITRIYIPENKNP